MFPIHHLPFTISLLSSPANRRQDRYLAIVWQSGVEQLLAANVVVVQENVYMLPDTSLFVHHSIAQARMQLPQTSQRFADCAGGRVQRDSALSVRKVSQETADVKSDHMNL